MPTLLSPASLPVGQPFTMNRQSMQAHGLIGWWPFAGSLGGPSIRDYVGNNNVAVKGSTSISEFAWLTDAQYGPVLDFARDRYLDVANSPQLLISGTFSVFIRVRFDTTGIQHGLVEHYDDAPNDGWGFRITSANKVQLFTVSNAGALGIVTGPTSITTGVWYDLIGVYTGADILVYINGYQDATAATTVNPQGDGQFPMRIGARGNDIGLNGATLDGKVHEVRLYNYPLSPALIWQISAPKTRWELYQFRPVKHLWVVDAGGTISPSGIDSTAAVGSHTLTGAATISPSGIASTVAVGTHTLSGAATISPSGVDSTAQVGTPDLSGLATIGPSGIGSTATVGEPALTSAATISPVGVASTSSIGTPTLSPGGLTISPSGISSTVTIGNPIVTDLGNLISPVGIPSTVSVGSPWITLIESPECIRDWNIDNVVLTSSQVIIEQMTLPRSTGTPSGDHDWTI